MEIIKQALEFEQRQTKSLFQLSDRIEISREAKSLILS